jgi:hypothetical protein
LFPCYVFASRDYFFKIWRARFACIKLRKWLRFSKCTFCEKYRAIRWARSTSKTDKADAINQLLDHYQLIKAERGYATSKANRAMECPTSALSIAIDGTDQLPKGLPQFSRDTSSDAPYTDRIAIKFTIARVHGLGTTCYDHGENIACDPNLTIEIVQRSLKLAEGHLGRLPPELYLQMDNCFRENKNSALFNWLGTLCERGLFPKGVFISFLPKGHTHNEVDQVASRLSVAVRRKNIATRPELYSILKHCFQGVEVVRLTQVADMKSYLNPNGNPNWTQTPFTRVVNINGFRYFKIQLAKLNGGTTRLELRTRDSCQQQHWSIAGDMRRKSAEPSGKDLRDLTCYQGTAIKPIPVTHMVRITKCLEQCRPRLSPHQWESIDLERKGLFEQPQLSELHWDDGGIFEQENDPDVEFAPEPQIREVQFEQHQGIFRNSSDKKNFLARSHPTSLLIGNYVAVADSKDDPSTWPKSTVVANIRVALITGFVKIDATTHIELEFLACRSRQLKNAKWRVMAHPSRIATIPVGDDTNVVATWDVFGFTPKTRIVKYYRSIINYKLMLRAAGEENWNRMPATVASNPADEYESVVNERLTEPILRDSERARDGAGRPDRAYSSVSAQIAPGLAKAADLVDPQGSDSEPEGGDSADEGDEGVDPEASDSEPEDDGEIKQEEYLNAVEPPAFDPAREATIRPHYNWHSHNTGMRAPQLAALWADMVDKNLKWRWAQEAAAGGGRVTRKRKKRQ